MPVFDQILRIVFTLCVLSVLIAAGLAVFAAYTPEHEEVSNVIQACLGVFEFTAGGLGGLVTGKAIAEVRP